MPLRIRILLILSLAVFLPLMACILLVAFSSYQNNLTIAGDYHLSRAKEMDRGLHAYLHNRASFTHQLVSQSDSFKALLYPHHRQYAYQGWRQTQDNWSKYNTLSPELAWFTQGETQRRFLKLQQADRSLVSYLVTDRNGYPLSASFKPDQFAHFDATWWKTIYREPAHTILIRPIISSEGNADRLEIIGALTPESNPEEVQAFLRIEVSLTPIIEDFSHTPLWGKFEGVLAKSDGSILLQNGEPFASIENLTLPHSILHSLQDQPNTINTNEQSMLGNSAMIVAAYRTPEAVDPLKFISVSGQERSRAILPLLHQHSRQLLLTLGVILLSTFIGLFYMRQTISGPIELIRSVTREVQLLSEEKAKIRRSGAQKIVAPLSDIHTGDEIEGLAKEFSGMARKVLGFQHQLEREVEAKTLTIQEDLEMAKEFQQALLTTDYPEIETRRKSNASLEFAHAYRPAATVSGDFFDIVKIDGYRYAAFIGDVMGHGARSALVTAILRALVEDICLSHPEPKHFMEELNRRFCEIIERSGQTVFVTASYLLFDTKESTISVCCAGHPSPLTIGPQNERAHPMISSQNGALPLGLSQSVKYESKVLPMKHGELILLYTDGITEAENSNGLEFGEDLLMRQLAKFAPLDTVSVAQGLEAAVMTHTDGQLEDDFCLLLIRITENQHHTSSNGNTSSKAAMTPS